MIGDCKVCGLVEPRISPIRETAFCPICGRWMDLEDPFEATEDDDGQGLELV